MTEHSKMLPDACKDMGDVREEIDRLDRALVRLIAERQRYIEAAARIKDREDEVRLQWRIDDVLAKVKAEAARQGLDWAIAEPVWRQMMDRCIAHEGVVWRRLRGLPPKT
ncbi:MAG: chorismate mutase [Parvularculaceae bacterium]|nr:chorismate mutase [Parvularculaceae bacterium]